MKNKIQVGLKKGFILGLLLIGSLCWAESKYRPPIEWLEKRQKIVDEYQSQIKVYKQQFYNDVNQIYEFYVANCAGNLINALMSDNYKYEIRRLRRDYMKSIREFNKERKNKLEELKIEFQMSTGRPVDVNAKGREYAWLNRSYVSYVEHPEYLSKREEIITAYNEQITSLKKEFLDKLIKLQCDYLNDLISEEEYKNERKKLSSEHSEAVKSVKKWKQETLFDLKREYRRKYPAIGNALHKGDPKYIEEKEAIVSNYEDEVRAIRACAADEIAEYKKYYKEGQISYSEYCDSVKLVKIRKAQELARLKAWYRAALTDLENRYRLKYGLEVK